MRGPIVLAAAGAAALIAVLLLALRAAVAPMLGPEKPHHAFVSLAAVSTTDAAPYPTDPAGSGASAPASDPGLLDSFTSAPGRGAHSSTYGHGAQLEAQAARTELPVRVAAEPMGARPEAADVLAAWACVGEGSVAPEDVPVWSAALECAGYPLEAWSVLLHAEETAATAADLLSFASGAATEAERAARPATAVYAEDPAAFEQAVLQGDLWAESELAHEGPLLWARCLAVAVAHTEFARGEALAQRLREAVEATDATDPPLPEALTLLHGVRALLYQAGALHRLGQLRKVPVPATDPHGIPISVLELTVEGRRLKTHRDRTLEALRSVQTHLYGRLLRQPRFADPVALQILVDRWADDGRRQDHPHTTIAACETYVAARMGDAHSATCLERIADVYRTPLGRPEAALRYLEALAQGYPGTAEGARATLRGAAGLLEADRADEALRWIESGFGPPPTEASRPYVAMAEFMTARCESQLGKRAERDRRIGALASDAGDSELASRALYWLAEQKMDERAYDEAGDLLRRIREAYPSTRVSLLAEESLSGIERARQTHLYRE